MTRKHATLSYALPLAAALVVTLVMTPPAWADEEAPTPKKVKVRIATDGDEETEVLVEESTRNDAPGTTQRSPMRIIQEWMQSRVAQGMTAGGAKPANPWLKHWFESDADVPMADLRDALKTEGWNADSMHAWMVGAMTRGGMRFFSRGGPDMRGLLGGTEAPRTFTWFDQQDEQGPRPRARGFGMRGPTTGGPRVHTEQRAWVLWHDGERWQRKALPGGTDGWMRGGGRGSPGGQGRRGGPHHGGRWQPRGFRGQNGRSAPMPQGMDIENLLRELLRGEAPQTPRRRADMGAGRQEHMKLLRKLMRAKSGRAAIETRRTLRRALRELRSREGDMGGGQRAKKPQPRPMQERNDLEGLLRMLQGVTKDGPASEGHAVHGLEQLRKALKELRGAIGREGEQGSGQRGEDGAPGTSGRPGQGGAGGRAAPKSKNSGTSKHPGTPKPVKPKKVRVVIGD